MTIHRGMNFPEGHQSSKEYCSTYINHRKPKKLISHGWEDEKVSLHLRVGHPEIQAAAFRENANDTAWGVGRGEINLSVELEFPRGWSPKRPGASSSTIILPLRAFHGLSEVLEFERWNCFPLDTISKRFGNTRGRRSSLCPSRHPALLRATPPPPGSFRRRVLLLHHSESPRSLGRSSSDPRRGKWTTLNGQTEKPAASNAGESLCNGDAQIMCVQSTLFKGNHPPPRPRPRCPSSTLWHADTRVYATEANI